MRQVGLVPIQELSGPDMDMVGLDMDPGPTVGPGEDTDGRVTTAGLVAMDGLVTTDGQVGTEVITDLKLCPWSCPQDTSLTPPKWLLPRART